MFEASPPPRDCSHVSDRQNLLTAQFSPILPLLRSGNILRPAVALHEAAGKLIGEHFGGSQLDIESLVFMGRRLEKLQEDVRGHSANKALQVLKRAFEVSIDQVLLWDLARRATGDAPGEKESAVAGIPVGLKALMSEWHHALGEDGAFHLWRQREVAVTQLRVLRSFLGLYDERRRLREMTLKGVEGYSGTAPPGSAVTFAGEVSSLVEAVAVRLASHNGGRLSIVVQLLDDWREETRFFVCLSEASQDFAKKLAEKPDQSPMFLGELLKGVNFWCGAMVSPYLETVELGIRQGKRECPLRGCFFEMKRRLFVDGESALTKTVSEKRDGALLTLMKKVVGAGADEGWSLFSRDVAFYWLLGDTLPVALERTIEAWRLRPGGDHGSAGEV